MHDKLIKVGTVSLRFPHGVQMVQGWRYQEFAVHKAIKGWRLSHLPSGLAVATAFASLGVACDCMIEIAKLRNDWAIMVGSDFLPLRDKVAAIVHRYKGSMPYENNEPTAGPDLMHPHLNRYKPESN